MADRFVLLVYNSYVDYVLLDIAAIFIALTAYPLITWILPFSFIFLRSISVRIDVSALLA
jgi:hypothetical protein